MIHVGDCREVLPTLDAGSVQCVVTSPPYWGLRDYGVEGQIGLEATPEQYVESLVGVFRKVRRVLQEDGTLWLNLGDTYAAGGHGGGGSFMEMRGGDGSRGSGAWAHRKKKTGWRSPPDGLKPKDLVGIPWRVGFALQADGWWLRSAVVWHKPNPMPESVTDRPTSSYEFVFLLAQSERYYFDADAVREPSSPNKPWSTESSNGGTKIGVVRGDGDSGSLGIPASASKGRNIRNVWTIPTRPFPEAHFATFPEDLVVPCIKAGSPLGGTVLDPFAGAGTVGVVSSKFGRDFIGIELNPEYADMARRRIADSPMSLWSSSTSAPDRGRDHGG